MRGIIAACLGAGLLTGCLKTGPCYAPKEPDFYDEADRLFECYQELPFTTPGEMPTSGTAQYDGQMYIASSHEYMDGEGVLTADFNNKTVSGSISNWLSDNRGFLNGDVVVSGAQISGASVINGSVTSNLSDGSGNTYDLSPFTPFSGDFLGGDAEMMAGFFTTTGQWSDETFGTYTIDGAFLGLK